MFKLSLHKLLVWLRFIRKPDFYVRIQDLYPTPNELTDNFLVIVRDDAHDKWACFRCLGGCGEKVQLSLNAQRRPNWSIKLDWLNRPTITPSVRMTNQCKCHYWLRKGSIEWCTDSGVTK